MNDQQLKSDFLQEARELLDGVADDVLKAEAEPDNEEIINAVFRGIHTFKGSAGTIEVEPLVKFAHGLEEVLDALRNHELSLEAEIVDTVLAANDHLISMLDAFESEKDMPDGSTLSAQLRSFLKPAAGDEPESAPQARKKSLLAPPSTEAVEGPVDDEGAGAPIIPVIEAEDIEEFMLDAVERLDNLATDVEAYEKEDDSKILNDIFRNIHTIKGDAAYLQLEKTAAYAHLFESLLSRLRDGKISRGPEVCDLLIRGVDALREIIDRLGRGEMVESLPPLSAELREFCADSSPAPAAEDSSGDLLQALPDDMREVFLDQIAQQRRILISHAVPPLDDKGRLIVKRALKGLKTAASFVDIATFTLLVEKGLTALDGEDEALTAAVKEICGFIDGLAGRSKPLGEILVEDGEVSKEDVDEAVRSQRPVGEILVAQGKVSKDDVEKALNSQKPVGEILVERGKVKPRKVKDALKRQELMAVANQLKPAAFGGREIDTMRVNEAKIENFANMIGELLISRNTFEYILDELFENRRPAADCVRLLRDELHGFSRLVNDMHHGIMAMRMIPVGGIFQKFSRVVRDISRKQHKEIQLIIQGESTEIDKKVADRLAEPLIHLVRNSCDHGIESRAERLAAGKPEQGTLLLSANHEGSSLVIKISDDGRGIDRHLLYEKAVGRGMTVVPEEKISLAELIFMPGLSSKESATDLSGRGVGMDVVHNTVTSLKGSVTVLSEEGEGTEIVLSLPMSLGISTMLLVETGGTAYAIPFEHVIEAMKIKPEMLHGSRDDLMFSYRGQVIALEFLANLLGGAGLNNKIPATGEISLVIIEARGRRVGIIVDRFARIMELAIKPMPSSLAAMDAVSGVSIMGDGKLILALNTEKLI
ncbi:MAG TPA: chemotaxis protein CheA [Desulfobacterales bacterium]|nr:chemotaxis protein CheA [Desulfobacterales bacterium]